MPATPTPSFGVVYPLWNHTRDPGNLLDRLVGEVGIDHITIPVVTGPIERFRPFFFPDAPYFGTEGGFHYPPGPAIAATGVKPQLAEWCGKRDVLRQVCDDARKAGLSILFRLCFADLTKLCRSYPQFATTNAWGQVSLHSRPCFSNPQFRALVEATCADLAATYEPSGFQFDNVTLDDDLTTECWAMDTTFDSLSACFCSACRQTALAAGVELDHAVEIARNRVLRLSANPAEEESAGQQLEPEPTWRAYSEVRRRSLNAWLHSLAQTHACRACWLIVRNADAAPPAGWNRILWTSTVLKTWGLIEDDQTPAMPGLCCAVTSRRPLAADLVVIVQRALSGGTQFFDFDEVECCLFEVLTALKQAVRYARRT